MKLVTWNVNSLVQRLPRVLAMLERFSPDVVCLQETKVTDEAFPAENIEAAGYHIERFGQRAFNGVAILSREAPTDVARGFAGDPVPDEARVLTCRYGALRVTCVYAVNGKEVGLPAYDTKLAWYDGLLAWLRDDAASDEAAVIAGDFNITPDDRDVHDPELWRGRNLASEPERQRIEELEGLGFVDLGRRSAGDVAGPFTYWDYRAGAFHKGWGLRIDLAFGNEQTASRLVSVEVDRNERRPKAGEGKPSDHAPVVVTLG